LEPVIEDINSDEIQREIAGVNTLNKSIIWLRLATLIGTLTSSFWLIYITYISNGIWAVLLLCALLSIVYKFGVSPIFAVVASILHFHFRVVGIWLPLGSYVFAMVLLYVDLCNDKLRRQQA